MAKRTSPEAILKIGKHHSANFETLCRAVKNGDAGLMVVFDKATGREQVCVMAFHKENDGGIGFVPFALMFNENPYDRLIPPNPEGGYFEEEKPCPEVKTRRARTRAAANRSCVGDAQN